VLSMIPQYRETETACWPELIEVYFAAHWSEGRLPGLTPIGTHMSSRRWCLDESWSHTGSHTRSLRKTPS